eukprot:365192-Chlamydomonas_euryale.AAC.16
MPFRHRNHKGKLPVTGSPYWHRVPSDGMIVSGSHLSSIPCVAKYWIRERQGGSQDSNVHIDDYISLPAAVPGLSPMPCQWSKARQLQPAADRGAKAIKQPLRQRNIHASCQKTSTGRRLSITRRVTRCRGGPGDATWRHGCSPSMADMHTEGLMHVSKNWLRRSPFVDGRTASPSPATVAAPLSSRDSCRRAAHLPAAAG